jgi:hypothetical protein
VDVYLHAFLTSALDGGGRFIPGDRTPRYPLYRRLGGPQSRMDAVAKRKIPYPFMVWYLVKHRNNFTFTIGYCKGIRLK